MSGCIVVVFQLYFMYAPVRLIPSLCLSLCLPLVACLSVCLQVRPSVRLSVCRYALVFLSACLHDDMSDMEWINNNKNEQQINQHSNCQTTKPPDHFFLSQHWRSLEALSVSLHLSRERRPAATHTWLHCHGPIVGERRERGHLATAYIDCIGDYSIYDDMTHDCHSITTYL